jgi:UrcA family protein
MGIIARLPFSVWLPAVALALLPAYAAAAPPDRPATGVQRVAPAERSISQGGANGEASSVRIAYRDLDLATPEGIAALYVRIRRAAVEVCDAGRPVTGTRVIRPEMDACIRRSVGATVRQIGIPGLAALDAEQQVLGDEKAERPACEAPVRAKIII